MRPSIACSVLLALTLAPAALATEAAKPSLFFTQGNHVGFGHAGHIMTIERGPTDMPYVYDNPWSDPYVATVQAGETIELFYMRRAVDVGATGAITRITAFFSADGGATKQVELDRSRPEYAYAQLLVPADARDRLEVWLEVETDEGDRVWDSAFGRNYHVDVVPAGCATIRFEAPRDGQWHDPQPSQPLRARQGLCLSYELERIKILGVPAGSYRGQIAEPWVRGWVSFQDGAGRELARYAFDRSPQAPVNLVGIPADARVAEVWFHGWSYYAGSAERWDSNFGANFRYAVAP